MNEHRTPRLDEGQQFHIRGELQSKNQSIRGLAKFYGVSEYEIRAVRDRTGKYAPEKPNQTEGYLGVIRNTETPGKLPWRARQRAVAKKLHLTPSIDDILAMDGRRTVAAPAVLSPVRPIKFSVSSVQGAIRAFLHGGQSNHSANRGMVGFIIAYCEAHGIPYSIHAYFDKVRRLGYYIRREKDLSEELDQPMSLSVRLQVEPDLT